MFSFPVTIPQDENQVVPSSSGFQETSTDSNHLEDLVAPERVEIDTNSPPEVLNIIFLNNFFFLPKF